MRTNCGNEADHTSPHSLHSGVSLQPISAPSSVKTESSKLSFIALGGVRIKTALYSLKSPEEGRACSAYSATKFFQQLWEPHFMTLYPHFTPSLCFLSFYCLSKEKFLLFSASQSSVHFFHNWAKDHLLPHQYCQRLLRNVAMPFWLISPPTNTFTCRAIFLFTIFPWHSFYLCWIKINQSGVCHSKPCNLAWQHDIITSQAILVLYD